MVYMTTKQAAKKWNISDRRVRTLCKEGKILGLVESNFTGYRLTGAKKWIQKTIDIVKNF